MLEIHLKWWLISGPHQHNKKNYLKLTSDYENDGAEEAHDTHALDHDHEVGVGGSVGQHRHDEARHEEGEAQVGEDEQWHLAHPRLRRRR